MNPHRLAMVRFDVVNRILETLGRWDALPVDYAIMSRTRKHKPNSDFYLRRHRTSAHSKRARLELAQMDELIDELMAETIQWPFFGCARYGGEDWNLGETAFSVSGSLISSSDIAKGIRPTGSQ